VIGGKDYMSGNQLVSVITHFLNGERFMEEAIESVIEQSYEQWELLLINDGSSDGSEEIARRYAERYPEKVRYIEHEGCRNLGMSASRNAGVREGRGELIAFLDADDVWMRRKLEEQVEIMEREPEAAMVYGRTLYWFSWSESGAGSQRDSMKNPRILTDRIIEPPLLLIKFLRYETPVPCPSDILVRREAIARAGGFEESFRRIFTDQAFYAKLCLRQSVFVSDRCWFKYRKHPASAVSVVEKAGQLRSARLAYLSWLEEYLSMEEIDDGEVWRALKWAQRRCRYPALSRLPEHAHYRGLIMKEMLRQAARQVLPGAVHRRLRRHWRNLTGQSR
jgi:glycosyltransferase involved in cell wall biosynthesis